MSEWKDLYNPFNSMKVLVWSEHLEALSKGEIIPPVTVDTDPTTQCNFNCTWCNAHRYRGKGNQSLSWNQLNDLVNIYDKWRVKSTCIAGGGEPTLNPHLEQFIYLLSTKNIESGIITNGSVITKNQIDMIVRHSRWVGFSVDAGDAETHIKIKGIRDKKIFRTVIDNLSKLCSLREKRRTVCDVAFKFLVSPLNVHTIYEAAKLAKEIGCQHFHLRPVCTDNLEATVLHEKTKFDSVIKEAKYQIQKAQTLDDDNFEVFGVQHKFGLKWERIIRFDKCRATPLLATFGADGNCHLCFDLRGKDEWIMCKHKDIIEYWGSEKHKSLIESIVPEKCPRCTFGAYNEIIKKVFIEDKMCRNFP